MRPVAAAIICLLLGSLSATGQIRLVDSLEQHLDTQMSDIDRVDLLNTIVYVYITQDTAKVSLYSTAAIELSKRINYTRGEAVAYTYRGVQCYLSGNFSEAQDNLHRGLKLSIDANDKSNVGYALLQLGICNLEQTRTDSSLHYFKKAFEIYRDSTDPTTLSKLYRNMSALYGQRYDYKSQAQYLDRAIAIQRNLSNKSLLIDALIVKAGNHFTAGEYLSANDVLAEAEQLIVYHHDDENLNDIRNLRALMQFQEGNFEDALLLLDSARQYYFEKGLIRKYITLLTDMGKVFAARGEYELALNNLYEALRISKLRGYDTETFDIRNRIGWINFHLGDMQQALRLADEGLASNLNYLRGYRANAFTLKGVVLTSLREFEKAGICLDSAESIVETLQDNRALSDVILNKARLEAQQNNLRKSLQLYNESIRLAELAGFEAGLAWSQWGIADAYTKIRDYKSADHYLSLSEAYSIRTHSNELLVRTYLTRSDLLAAQGLYKESLAFSRMAGTLKDSIHHTDLARRFMDFEKMAEIAERDRSIQVLQKDKLLAEEKIRLQEAELRTQRLLIIAGFGGLVMLSALAWVYYRYYRKVTQLNATITEKNERIQAQANKFEEMNGELKRLYKELSKQNEAITKQAGELSERNRDINDLNRNLESLVAEKTRELQRTNEELVRHNNELLQFSYTVSHNLRGPVARLMGLSELASAEQDLVNAQRWIDYMKSTASDIDLIIRDLNKILDARNELNQYLESVDLETEWKQSLSLLQDSLSGREKIIADFSGCPSIITVKAMLQSILYNLLSNAIKFRSPLRELSVTAKSTISSGHVLIEIADNGLGMDLTRYKDKVFQLYRRFHPHVQGRGMGLYMIKSQVEVLHGNVEVDSLPDRGTRFTITLPLHSETSVSSTDDLRSPDEAITTPARSDVSQGNS